MTICAPPPSIPAKHWNADTKPVGGEPPETDIVYVGDMSGSMAGLENDTIGGFNAFIEAQKKLPGEVRVTVSLFNNSIKTLAERQPIHDLPELTLKDYFPSGGTALVDAVGSTLQRLEENPPKGRVLVVVDTDGEENSSHKYNLNHVRHKIEELTKRGWGFVFLGANTSAWQAAQMGFQNAGASVASPSGVNTKYQNLNATTTLLRSNVGASFAATAQGLNYNTSDLFSGPIVPPDQEVKP